MSKKKRPATQPSLANRPRTPARTQRQLSRGRIVALLGVVALMVVAALLIVSRPWRESRSELLALPGPQTAFVEPIVRREDFVGSEKCASCHQREFGMWKASTHAAAGGVPPMVKVIARFNGAPIRFRDATVIPATAGGRFTFTVKRPGRPDRTYRVDGVIGGGHMQGGGTQGFVTRVVDGTYRFLPFDFSRHSNRWFCNTIGRADHGWQPITPDLSLDECVDFPPVRALGDDARFSNCASCHGSQITMALDTVARRYRTEFTSLGINCESCHGPGRRHLALVADTGAVARGDVGMAALATYPKDSSLGTCWQCHALKDQLRKGYVSGKPLEAYYAMRTPQLGDEAHLPDGRVRTFAYQQGHLYSDCYVNGGMTCTSCHDPHSQGYRDVNGVALTGRFDDRQCTSCHASKGVKPALHTRHKSGSPGSQCTSCHMPYLQEPELGPSIQYARSDHAIPIPRPAFDSTLGVRSACRICHADRSEGALDAQVRAWWGEVKPHARAIDALVEAQRGGDRASVAKLLLVPDERHTAALFAGMAWFLEHHLAPDVPELEDDVVRRLEKLATHPDPDVRALALASLHYSAGQDNAVRRVLADALRQPQPADHLLRSRWVVILGYLGDKARGEGKADVAIRTYRKALEVEPENARVYQNLGLAYSMTRSLDQAVQAYRRSLEIDGSQPLTLVNLGIAYDEQRQGAQAVAAYERAIALNEFEPLAWFNLGNVYLKSGDLPEAKSDYERALASDPSIAAANFYLARIALQQRDFPAALAALESGLEFDPKNAEALQMRDQLQKAGVQPRRASPGGR